MSTADDTGIPAIPSSQEAKETIDEYVGKMLRNFRERAGLTLQECANQVGVSHQQIHKYEVGQTKISSSILYKFCKIFSVTPNCFFEGYPAENLDAEDGQESVLSDKINILFIEDNAEDQYLIRRAIEENELEANLFFMHDTEAVLDILKKRNTVTKIPQPDLIFLDLNIPKIDGHAFLRTIKQSKETRHIPILILTGSTMRQDVIRSYENYASGYVRKSFDYETRKKDLQLAIRYWTEVVVLPHRAWA